MRTHSNNADDDLVFIGFKTDRELAEALKRHAAADDRTISWTIRELLRLALAVRGVHREAR